ncbi:bluetail domain-containing putative surface protein [Castellaniella defragrans]|uniref:Uncharacterized protein n=1 Tax=Castellaniella defragrans TaxID=75697 RepID=A0A7W9TKD9_CASDE|nr:bluetail domain-containing putative surface protein [Castellaniella defragrans]MBB6082305.1 hypothetical protein [Castellaniella defragrans]
MTFAAGEFNGDGMVNGGVGTNTLVLADTVIDGTLATAIGGPSVISFQNLQLHATQAFTLDLTLSGFTTLDLAGRVQSAGAAGSAGTPSADGATGVTPGGAGGDGAAGEDGDDGAAGTGLVFTGVHHDISLVIHQDITVLGGAGGAGANGGNGGFGGNGAVGSILHFDGGNGGHGGSGSHGGAGGNGGNAGSALSVSQSGGHEISLVLAGVTLQSIGGAGGSGGKGGNGGAGGNGGNGWAGGNGGNGGNGGHGGDGGHGGNGGAGGVVVDLHDFNAVNIVSNTNADGSVADNLLVSQGGDGGVGGSLGIGGAAGLRGLSDGGTGGTDGTGGSPGSVGNTGLAGVAGAGLSVAAGAVVNISGAANLSLGLVQGTDITLDATALSGNLTAATDSGADTIRGGSGQNQITLNGGADSVDLARSLARSDVLVIQSATDLDARNGKFIEIAGFDTMAAHGDVLKIAGYTGIVENRDTIVGGGVTVHASQGIATFSGIVDETDLAGRITAAFQVLGSSSSGNALAFVFEGDTYLAVERGGDSSYQAGTDLVIQLTGVTDLAALGSAAADHTLVLQAA